MPSFLITPVITLSVLGFESDLRREARWWQTGTQQSELHPSSSSWSSVHGDPPPDAGTATGRSRFRLPPPQVAEHGVQGCQSPAWSDRHRNSGLPPPLLTRFPLHLVAL